MRRFHPPLTLTSAHRCMRTQLRAVHGASTSASAMAETAAARRAPNRSGTPAGIASAPRTGARRIDCGRTSVATPIAAPSATSQGHERRAARARRREARREDEERRRGSLGHHRRGVRDERGMQRDHETRGERPPARHALAVDDPVRAVRGRRPEERIDGHRDARSIAPTRA